MQEIFQTVQDLEEHLRLNGHLDRQILHAFDAIWSIALLIRASIQQRSIEQIYDFDNDVLFFFRMILAYPLKSSGIVQHI